tara:strand:- start:1582 stop:2352 length:771 start_codon:yes stop_codon:yes gene_type:complete
MATLEELQQQQYAQTIIPGLQEMTRPESVPTGAQLAPGFMPEQLQAANIMQQGIGAYQPFLTAGGQSLATALQSTGPQAMQSYMNPYTQDVVDTTIADLERQFGVQRAGEAQRQIQSGGMRGAATRGAIADTELARTQNEAMTSALAKLRFGAADAAQQAAQQAAQTQAGIGELYGGLGQRAQTGLMGDVGQLFDIGEAQRQIVGAQNLANYQTPFYGLGQFANILSGMPTPQQYQSPNPILTGLAAAGGIGNLFG